MVSSSTRQAEAINPSSSSASDLWSDLLPDLISTISTRLTHLDLPRLRAICRPWRSSTPPPQSLTASLLSSSKIPLPNHLISNYERSVVAEFRKYYIKPDSQEGYIANNWVTEEWKETKRDLNEIFKPSGSFNSLYLPRQFRVFELSVWYGVEFVVGGESESLLKLKVVPSVVKDGRVGREDFCLMAIHRGDLLHLRLGDEKWSSIEKVVGEPARYYNNGWFRNGKVVRAWCYSDVLYRKGKGMFCAVDNIGNLAMIDSSLNVEAVKWPFPVNDFYESRFLLESEGKLYQVVLVVCIRPCRSMKLMHDVGIKIYGLDDDEGRKRWERVYELRDRAFFISQCSSFSVAALDFPGLRMNSVYFDGPHNGKCYGRLCVFNVANSDWIPFTSDQNPVEG